MTREKKQKQKRRESSVLTGKIVISVRGKEQREKVENKVKEERQKNLCDN